MKIDDGALQVEITIVPPKGRSGGRKIGLKVPDRPPIPRITRLMALAINSRIWSTAAKSVTTPTSPVWSRFACADDPDYELAESSP